MSRLVEDVLDAWRLGERLLGQLPPVDPDHETVRMEVDRLRVLYRELTILKARSLESIDASQHALTTARNLLRRVNARGDLAPKTPRSDIAEPSS